MYEITNNSHKTQEQIYIFTKQVDQRGDLYFQMFERHSLQAVFENHSTARFKRTLHT